MDRRKHLAVRTDRATGDLWLWNERDKRRVKNITNDVLLSLCADLFAEDGTTSMSREVRFADGAAARITVENLR